MESLLHDAQRHSAIHHSTRSSTAREDRSAGVEELGWCWGGAVLLRSGGAKAELMGAARVTVRCSAVVVANIVAWQAAVGLLSAAQQPSPWLRTLCASLPVHSSRPTPWAAQGSHEPWGGIPFDSGARGRKMDAGAEGAWHMGRVRGPCCRCRSVSRSSDLPPHETCGTLLEPPSDDAVSTVRCFSLLYCTGMCMAAICGHGLLLVHPTEFDVSRSQFQRVASGILHLIAQFTLLLYYLQYCTVQCRRK